MSFIYYVLRAFFVRISAITKTLSLRAAYAKDLQDIRKQIRGRKVKVLFPVNEIAKWKSQSVYDLMVQSTKFEPVIALTLADISWRLTTEEQEGKLKDLREFFERRNMPLVMAYDLQARKAIDFRVFSPDIVFYSQPWDYAEVQMPASVAFYALTCYVPYFVLNYGYIDIDVMCEFHREIWRHFLLTKAWARRYARHTHFWTHAGKLLGTGHPQLDFFYLNKDQFETTNMVIYAPHWSISSEKYDTFENYSTFLQMGRFILEYAWRHPEFQWVFKPHPSLKFALRESGEWTDAQIDEYWSEWEKIGVGCYTCDYPSLFVKSKALITDCGSFLPEYFVTGKPLIHLISGNRKIEPAPPAKMYFDTFYQVHNENELLAVLSRVVEQGDDYRKNERLSMLEKVGLQGNYAAKNIVDHLCAELRIARPKLDFVPH